MVKLLPGEKMIIKSENNQQLVLDSHTIQKKYAFHLLYY